MGRADLVRPLLYSLANETDLYLQRTVKYSKLTAGVNPKMENFSVPLLFVRTGGGQDEESLYGFCYPCGEPDRDPTTSPKFVRSLVGGGGRLTNT